MVFGYLGIFMFQVSGVKYIHTYNSLHGTAAFVRYNMSTNWNPTCTLASPFITYCPVLPNGWPPAAIKWSCRNLPKPFQMDET